MSLFNRKKYIRENLKKGYANKSKIPNSLFKKSKFIAPENFSLTNNTNEVSLFLNNIIEYMTSTAKEFDFFYLEYDLHAVRKVSIDALMYMLALSNFKPLKAVYKFKMILPIDEEIRSFIFSTGMNEYVINGDVYSCEKNRNFHALKWGDKVDTQIAQSICNFVNEILGTNLIYSKFIYSTLIEMMLNTENHAYLHKAWIYRPQWYVFVENTNDNIKFTFLDVGAGIPDTMINRIYKIVIDENFENFFELKHTQSKLLMQALKEGNFVSRTKQKNRGKGLPQIYSQYLDGKTSNFNVLSGKGFVRFDDSHREDPNLIELENKFNGTLFYWEIDKLKSLNFDCNEKDDIILI